MFTCANGERTLGSWEFYGSGASSARFSEISPHAIHSQMGISYSWMHGLRCWGTGRLPDKKLSPTDAEAGLRTPKKSLNRELKIPGGL
jgi:hypothetical protein